MTITGKNCVIYKEKKRDKNENNNGDRKLVCIYNQKGFVNYYPKNIGFHYLDRSDKKYKINGSCFSIQIKKE